MTDLFDFFTPVDIHLLDATKFGGFITRDKIHYNDHQPDFEGVQIAFLGIEEDRKTIDNVGCSSGANAARIEIYKLYNTDVDVNWIDLGNIKAGNEYSDTCFAVRSVCQTLIKNNVIPLIVGGSQDLSYSNYQGYENLEQVINIVNLDHKIDLGEDGEIDSENYLRKIVLHEPNFLFNFCNIGHQRPLVKKEHLELLEKMYFDSMRLGKLFNMVHESEPYIRNADIVSIDLSVVRMSDSPGCANAGPNGLYADQICQVCKYAGISDKLTSFGIYEFNPECDINGQSAKLVAQMIWYFIEGYSNRKKDFPIGDKEDYIKYTVPLEREDYDIIFYKSPRSQRWWMDVPYAAGTKNTYIRHHLVPCSYSDYQIATNDDIPDLWWKTYQKLA